MPTSTSSDLDLDALLADDESFACECRHSDREDDLCKQPATFRVTVVCVAEGCDCAAGVHLLCHECLSAWEENAPKDGVELRVTPL